MTLDVVYDVGLADPAEVAGAARAHLTQEEPDERQMMDDALRRQTSFFLQILAKRLEDLLMRGERPLHRRRNRPRLAQHKQQALQRRPVAWLDGLLPSSVPEVPLDRAFIEIGQLLACATVLSIAWRFGIDSVTTVYGLATSAVLAHLVLWSSNAFILRRGVGQRDVAEVALRQTPE